MQKNIIVYINRNIVLNYLTGISWILVWSLGSVLLKKACDATCFTITCEGYDIRSFENLSKLQIFSNFIKECLKVHVLTKFF